jgi:hypothetical protein
VFAFELLFPLVLLVRDWRLKLLAAIGATTFHLANYFLMNVQFFLYPFVFVAFFNMNRFHEWAKARLRLRKPAAAAN